MFSRVRNPFLTLFLSYHAWVTSKIQINFRYRRYLKVLMIVSYEFSKFLLYSCFLGWGIHFWYSYWATMLRWLRISRSTFGTGGTWRLLMIVSYEFSKFLYYLCFRRLGIHFWYSYWATMFRWPRKSRSTSGTRGIWRYWWLCLMNFQNFFTIYVLRVRNPLSGVPTELLCSGVSDNSGKLPVQEVLIILSYEFLKFLHYLSFRGQWIHCWHSYWAAMF